MTSARTNWPLILALLVAGLFAGAQFGKLTLTLAEMRLAYPEGGVWVPVLVSIVGVVGILFGAVAGATISRIGVARLLVAALATGGLLSLIQATLPGLAIFAFLRALEGLSHLTIVVAAPTLMANLSNDHDRPLVMGIWAAFFGISLAILAAGLPSLLSLGGLPAVFAAHGVGMLVMAALLRRMLPRGVVAPGRRPSYIAEHKVIYTNPRLLIPGAGFVWYTILYIALLAVFPLALDLPVWALTALPLISIVGTLAGGVLAKQIPPDWLVAAGFALTIVAGGLVMLTGAALWTLFAVFFVMAFIPAGSFAAIPHFNSDLIDRARATGGIAQLGNVGTTLGTPVFVVLYELAGMTAVWWLTIAFCFAGIGATRLLRARIK